MKKALPKLVTGKRIASLKSKLMGHGAKSPLARSKKLGPKRPSTVAAIGRKKAC